MHAASVGFHCSECRRANPQRVISGASLRQAERPPVTVALVVANVAVHLTGALFGLADRMQVDGGLVAIGLTRDGFVGVAEGEWYRILTSGFLHAGLFHLAVNMYSLWILGSLLEPRLGSVRFGLLYVASLLAGSLGALALEPDALHVGASGAIFGLFGAVVAFQLSRGLNPFSTGVGTLLVVNLVITFALPGISIGGHLGGLAGGVLGGIALFGLPSRPTVPSLRREVALLGALAVLCTAAAIWVAGNPVVG
jgi:membrane associated rhomboid family serine protease